MYPSVFKLITLILLIIYPYTAFAQKRVTVSGYITNSGNEERLAGATVVTKDLNKGTYSNINGYYSISLHSGENILIFSYVGYKTMSVSIMLHKDTVINAELIQDNILEEVSVYAKKGHDNVLNTRPGVMDIPMLQIKTAPALFGEKDLLKYIQLMPGIQSGGDGNVGIIVRGGSFDQNIISLDGANLFNPEHLKGFVSVFNTDIIDGVTVYKGSFPAKYGSRLSGIVDIAVKNGDLNKYHGSFSAGILSSKLYFEGPLVKEKSSFLISARRSYYNLLADRLLKTVYDKPEAMSQFSNMFYYDLSAKVFHKFSSTDMLSCNFYLGRDIAGSNGRETSARHSDNENIYSHVSEYDVTNYWGNLVSGLNWRHIFNERLSAKIMLNFSRYHYNYTVESTQKSSVTILNPSIVKNATFIESSVRYLSGIRDISLNYDLIYTPSGKHNIMAGAQYSNQFFTPTVHTYRYTKSSVMEVVTENLRDTTLGNVSVLNNFALYAEDEFVIMKSVKVNAGLRLNGYSVNGKIYLIPEPRMSMRLLLGKNLSLKGAYSKMSQGIHLLSSSNLVMPSDIWVPATGSIKPMISNQYSAGVFYDTKNKISLSLEGYYKTMENLLEYRDGISYINSSQGWESLVSAGRGWSYGLEFMARKDLGRTTGSIAYTWSKSLRRFDREGNVIFNARTYYSRNDCRNNLSINISHKLGRKFDISATFIYKTGNRGTLSETILLGRSILVSTTETPEAGNISSHIPLPVINPSGSVILLNYTKLSAYTEKNGYKLPDYHRLDLGINYHFYSKKGQSILNVSIYNLYNHFNIYSVYPAYNGTSLVLKGLCLFPMLPSISYTYEF